MSVLLPYLTVALVSGDGDRVREIDAARVFARHRNLEERLAVAFVEGLGETRTLVAEG